MTLKGLFTIVKDSRLGRIILYYLFVVWGIKISGGNFPHFQMTIVFFALFCGGVFSVIVNNINDQASDKLNSPMRPLVNRLISINEYNRFKITFLIFSLFFLMMLDLNPALLISAPIINYYLYSARPFRIKMVPVLNKLILALNPIALIWGGILLSSGRTNFGIDFFISIFVSFFLMSHFIDLKDEEGDRFEGRKTIPTVFGLQKAIYIVGVMDLIGHLIMSRYFNNIFLIYIYLTISILTFFLLFKPVQNDNKIVFMKFFSIIFLFFMAH